MMDYATYHRLHARHRRLSLLRLDLRLQTAQSGDAVPRRLAFREAALDRAMGKVERRLADLRAAQSGAAQSGAAQAGAAGA